MAQVPTGFKVMLISLMIIFGSLYTLSYKFQNSQFISPSSSAVKREFYHPYMQTTIMFACQSLALLVYFSMKKIDLTGFDSRYRLGQKQGKSLQFSKFVMVLPAAADLAVSCLRYVALNFVSGSVFQIMRGGSIVTTFLFSRWLLGMKAQKYQLFGFFLAVLGLAMLGISSLVFQAKDQSHTYDEELVGYFLLVASLIIQGFYYTYEEKLFRQYHIEPLQMVGYEGVFGLIMSLFLVIGLAFVPCDTTTKNVCILAESPTNYFQQIGQNFVIMIFFLLGILAVSGFNIVGVTITKHLSGLSRTICHLSSTIIVWVVGLAMTISHQNTNPNEQKSANYDWQTTDGGGITLKVIGLILLMGGNLFYNHILVWKRLDPQYKKTTIIQESLNGETDSHHSSFKQRTEERVH